LFITLVTQHYRCKKLLCNKPSHYEKCGQKALQSHREAILCHCKWTPCIKNCNTKKQFHDGIFHIFWLAKRHILMLDSKKSSPLSSYARCFKFHSFCADCYSFIPPILYVLGIKVAFEKCCIPPKVLPLKLA